MKKKTSETNPKVSFYRDEEEVPVILMQNFFDATQN